MFTTVFSAKWTRRGGLSTIARMQPAKRAKPKPGRSGRKPATVEEYLERIPQPARRQVEKLRAAVRASVPKTATETISYGIPAFRDTRVLVWYAAFADHCSLFPTAEVIQEFRSELKGFSTSKGTIHFPLDEPIPVALVKRLVKARVAHAK